MKDYKKKYESALKVASKWHKDGIKDIRSVIECIFPELKENNDEILRKWLIKYFDKVNDVVEVDRKKIISWLEKQGEKFIPEDIDEAALQYVDTCTIDGKITHDNVTEPYWNNHSMMNAYKAGWLEKQDQKKHEEELENAYKCADEVQYRRGYEDAKRELKKQGEKVDVIKNFNTEFERQISHLIASTINKEHEYNEGFVKWAANALLNYAKHELEEQVEHKPQDKPALEVWKDMRLEVYQQASGNRHEPNYSDDSTKMFSLTDIDEIIDKIDEKQGEQNNKHLYDVIIALWDLLDKIDTFSDLQIDDTNPDNPFKKIEYIAQERHKFVKSDGYNLYIQGKQITDFKQSKQKPADKCIGCNNFKGCITCIDGDQYAHITEQKPTDNLEPKFKVGDWVVRNCKNNDTVIHKVVNIRLINDNCEIYGYELDDFTYVSGSFENEYRLWTIQDAKEGDVIFSNDGHGSDSIELIKSVYDKCINFWFCLSSKNNFKDYYYEVYNGNIPYTNFASRKDATPATRKQRDLLFAKMKEAGYEWDAEKKELKKIDARENLVLDGDLMQADCMIVEQKPTWSEEDERYYDSALWHIKNSCGIEGNVYNWLKSIKERVQAQLKQEWTGYDEKAYEIALLDIDKSPSITKNDSINWLKSLKNRVQPQPKQEWSEKDENMLQKAISTIRYALSIPADKEDDPCFAGSSIIAWLKSLKERNTWKPSDRQIKQLGWVAEQNKNNALGKELMTLYQDLKKLREE